MRTYILGILCAFFALNASSQLLWKVSGNNALGESYLFGTHHVAPFSVTDSIQGFNDAIESVELVIGEVDLVNLDPSLMQQLTMSYALAPADSLLTSVLTKPQVDSLNSVLSKYTQGQLTAEMLAAVKPSMISTMLALYQTSSIFPDFNQSEQLDGKILNLGHKLGKELAGFETFEEQLGFLFNTPIRIQAEQLMSDIKNDADAVHKAKELAAAYIAQDLEQLDVIMRAEMETEGDFAKRLITDRNDRWLSKLEEILPEKSVFVVVGSGHLPGNDGLIEGLRKKGYTVEPVK